MNNKSEIISFEKVSFKQFQNDMNEEFPIFSQLELQEMYDNILLPTRATPESSGHDFAMPFDVNLGVGKSIKIPTGIKVNMDSFLTMLIFPRSGLGFKYYIRLANTVGIGDRDYYNNKKNEGHYFVKIRNEGDFPISLKAGDYFCQGVIKIYFHKKL